jgi:Rrf2 family protein
MKWSDIMRISATEEYGLRCLLLLAKHGPDKQLSIPEIAEEEGLSVAYASKLLWTLRKADLVVAVRGRGGGFSIARLPSEINLHEVILTLGGPLIDAAHCKKHSGVLKSCVHLGNCSLHEILGGLSGFVQEFLKETTLEDMVSGTDRNFVETVLSRVAMNVNSTR